MEQEYTIQRYSSKEMKNDEWTIKKISKLIKETFDEINNFYTEKNIFKQEVTGNLEQIIRENDDTHMYYVIQDEKKEIIACLRGIVKEQVLNEEMGEGYAFFSKYVGVQNIYRQKWLARKLKKEFEKEAEEAMQRSHKPAMVASRVNKKNDISKQWNKANGYNERDEGKDSEYYLYYKDFLPPKNST